MDTDEIMGIHGIYLLLLPFSQRDVKQGHWAGEDVLKVLREKRKK